MEGQFSEAHFHDPAWHRSYGAENARSAHLRTDPHDLHMTLVKDVSACINDEPPQGAVSIVGVVFRRALRRSSMPRARRRTLDAAGGRSSIAADARSLWLQATPGGFLEKAYPCRERACQVFLLKC